MLFRSGEHEALELRDGDKKLEAILRRDWNLVKRMYGDMWKMDLQNEKERYRFLQLLTEIEWYLEGKGLMRMEEKRYGYAN